MTAGDGLFHWVDWSEDRTECGQRFEGSMRGTGGSHPLIPNPPDVPLCPECWDSAESLEAERKRQRGEP